MLEAADRMTKKRHKCSAHNVNVRHVHRSRQARACRLQGTWENALIRPHDSVLGTQLLLRIDICPCKVCVSPQVSFGLLKDKECICTSHYP